MILLYDQHIVPSLTSHVIMFIICFQIDTLIEKQVSIYCMFVPARPQAILLLSQRNDQSAF